jgi:hypothetical protein
MAKSPDQSDFVYVSPPRDPDEAEKGASPIATRWMYRLIVLALFVLFAVIAYGHIPGGG